MQKKKAVKEKTRKVYKIEPKIEYSEPVIKDKEAFTFEGDLDEKAVTISREVAYIDIYLKNRNKYPLRFKDYEVHHVDGNRLNNSAKNLCLLTKSQHKFIHDMQIKGNKFSSAEEIEDFIRKKFAPEKYDETKAEAVQPVQTKQEIKQEAKQPETKKDEKVDKDHSNIRRIIVVSVIIFLLVLLIGLGILYFVL